MTCSRAHGEQERRQYRLLARSEGGIASPKLLVSVTITFRLIPAWKHGMCARVRRKVHTVALDVVSSARAATSICYRQCAVRRPNNPLEVWDFGTGKLKDSIAWNRSTAQVTRTEEHLHLLVWADRLHLMRARHSSFDKLRCSQSVRGSHERYVRYTSTAGERHVASSVIANETCVRVTSHESHRECTSFAVKINAPPTSDFCMSHMHVLQRRHNQRFCTRRNLVHRPMVASTSLRAEVVPTRLR